MPVLLSDVINIYLECEIADLHKNNQVASFLSKPRRVYAFYHHYLYLYLYIYIYKLFMSFSEVLFRSNAMQSNSSVIRNVQ